MTPLRRRMTEDMQVRNFSPHTQNSYVQQVSLFARHFSKSPELLGPEEIRSYQVYLTNEKKLSPSSILIAVSALRFLYKVTLHRDWCLEDIIPAPKKPQKLPIVLSPEEVLQFLSCVQSIKHRTILTVCYAAGLRISEAVHLKVADIDSERMVIRVEQGKGEPCGNRRPHIVSGKGAGDLTNDQHCVRSTNSSQGCYLENLISRMVFKKRKSLKLGIW